MAAIDFPDSPVLGEFFSFLDRKWVWTGVAWETVATVLGAQGPQGATGPAGPVGPVSTTPGPTGPEGSQGKFYSSDTPPLYPSIGDSWFNSITGATYVYYDSYWVGASGGTAYANWSYVNSNRLALTNENFLADTSNGSFTIILPENPQPGEVNGFLDLENSFGRNTLILSGGAELIEGRTDNMILNVDRAIVMVKFVGSSYGWRIV
jgi:hypothetical protein